LSLLADGNHWFDVAYAYATDLGDRHVQAVFPLLLLEGVDGVKGTGCFAAGSGTDEYARPALLLKFLPSGKRSLSHFCKRFHD
jgi:hypothetical protein